MIVLSAFQARRLLAGEGKIKISLDLGKSISYATVEGDKVVFPSGEIITIDEVKKIIKNDHCCFFLEDNTIKKVALFSDETNRFYKLLPTGENTWPTLEISGIRMHVTRRYSPKEDTMEKLSYVTPCTGTVLDTCSGLGYTAIMAAETANLVYSFEKDANVIIVEKYNPWSSELFLSTKIKQINDDVFIGIKKINDCMFDRIIHDPPRLTLATTLYSQEFYIQLFRVLKPAGKIYHYTGDPGSKARGLDIRAGIMERMTRAGFINLKRVFNGVTAEKK
jgi:predicted methyltransferase